jgi:hypothetical protein
VVGSLGSSSDICADGSLDCDVNIPVNGSLGRSGDLRRDGSPTLTWHGYLIVHGLTLLGFTSCGALNPLSHTVSHGLRSCTI